MVTTVVVCFWMSCFIDWLIEEPRDDGPVDPDDV